MFVLGILSFLFWPILIIAIIIFLVSRRRKKGHAHTDSEWYFRLALSKEDLVSQLFFLLSVFFLGVTLLVLNRDFGDPLSWQTVMFIASVFAIFLGYYMKALYSFFLGLIGLPLWWGLQAREWMDVKDIKGSAITAGIAFFALLFYSLGRAHEKDVRWKRFSLAYSILGIFSITSILFFFSTNPGLSAFGEMTKYVPLVGSWQISVSLLVLFSSFIIAIILAFQNRLLSVRELCAILFLGIMFAIIAFLPFQAVYTHGSTYIYNSSSQSLTPAGLFWAIFFNLVVFLEMLGLIFSGYLRRETWLINLGAFFLFLLIVVKYFDWFFTFLDKSLFFIGAGILLFALGWFMEKGRRYMISTLKNQEPKPAQTT